MPEKDDRIKERTSKASAWFEDKFLLVFQDLLENLSVETDNKEIGKQINNAIENLRQDIRVKLAGFMSCQNGFDLHGYLDSVSRARFDFPVKRQRTHKARAYTESDVDHPQLFDTCFLHGGHYLHHKTIGDVLIRPEIDLLIGSLGQDSLELLRQVLRIDLHIVKIN